jgi:hypothetical protein
MDHKQTLLHHFLAALAYRTQKALRGAPAEFMLFRAGSKVRTPHELIRHMDDVLGIHGRVLLAGVTEHPNLSTSALLSRISMKRSSMSRGTSSWGRSSVR